MCYLGKQRSSEKCDFTNEITKASKTLSFSSCIALVDNITEAFCSLSHESFGSETKCVLIIAHNTTV